MPSASTPLARIIQLQQTGQIREAEVLCRELVEQHPDHPDLTHFLGLLNYQLGRNDEAARLIQQAIELKPANAEYHSNLGAILLAAGRSADAIAACRSALALQAKYPEAEANLGNALVAAGDLPDAEAAFRRAIEQRPAFPEAHNNLGNTQKARGALDGAIASYRAAIALRPQYADAHYNLGTALRDSHRIDEAINSFRHAIRMRPDYFEANLALAAAFDSVGRTSDAIDSYRTSATIAPRAAEPLVLLGKALRDNNQMKEAIATHRRAIALEPANADAHVNLAFDLLSIGEWSEGWPEYEWRQKLVKPSDDTLKDDSPRWQIGEAIAGRSILIRAEQGRGDMIQFARYVPMLAERGATVVLECYSELRRLFESLAGAPKLVEPGDTSTECDLQCPLLSLPLLFETTVETISTAVPYLQPDPAVVAKWSERMPASDGRINVGIAWAGSPTHRNDRERSIDPAHLAGLSAAKSVRWFSLQTDHPANTRRPDLELIDWTAELKDFADTAALMANLDLIITVDSAPAHLAGAIGQPVWLLLPQAADFRWLRDRDDTPWYPSMRLFRQSLRGDWPGVLQRVLEASAQKP